MDNTFVNIFNGVGDKDTSNKLSVLDIIAKISDGEWETKINAYRFETKEKRKEYLKRSLPAVTFSGTLAGEGRLDSNVKDYTGLVICDIDKIKKGKLNLYKNNLRDDNYVVAFFESPSKGLKVLIKVDTGIDYHNTHAFAQIEQYMKDHYDIVLDPSGKNLSRLCFVSHDPDMYYNDSFDVFPVDISVDYEALEIAETMQSVKHLTDDFEASSSSQHVFDTCCNWTTESATGSYHKTNRNNFVFALSCKLSRAGMSREIALTMVLGRYPSMGFKEIKTTVHSAYKITSSSFGSKPIRRRKSNQSNIF